MDRWNKKHIGLHNYGEIMSREEPGTSVMVPILYQRKVLVCNHEYGRWVIEIAMKQMPEKRRKPIKIS